MKKGPMTGWVRGDTVRTIAATCIGTRPDELPAGAFGRLHRCERVQDGSEVWTFWVGAVLRCATHQALQRIA